MIVNRRAPIYPIRTVAHLTGVNPRRIRAWEDQYHLLTPARTSGGHRLYSEEDLDRIRWVKAMVERGMSLKGIQRLVEGAPTEERAPERPMELATEGRGSNR
jgi:DNA-binding transcriptional MerR regulator